MNTNKNQKAGYTPGPWDIRYESFSGSAYICTAGGSVIAEVEKECGPDIPPIVSIKMPVAANACLIAGAPELLEALEHALAALVDAQKLHPAWIYTDARNAAEKAIAKAKGKI